MSHQEFQIASGGVIGRDHRVASRNRQDDLVVVRKGNCTVGIVADGCGSSSKSEVGASLGVRFLAEGITAEVGLTGSSARLRWRRVQQHLLSMLDINARMMGGNYRQTVKEYFLFTLVGFVLTDDGATFFAAGDGVVTINGKQYALGPFPGNKPPYVGYLLIPDDIETDPDEASIRIVEQLPLRDLQNFLVGSDGVNDLVKAAGRQLPGMPDRTVEPVDSFWTKDRYFGANGSLLGRDLSLISRDWPKRDPEPGLLPDDTSLIAGRRQPEPTTE